MSIKLIFLRMGALLLLMLIALVAHAQMVTGSKMTDYNKTFNLHDASDIDVSYQDCTIGCSVLWPKDQATFTFTINNHGAALDKGSVKVELVPYGTRSTPGDIWRPVVFPRTEIATTSNVLDQEFPQGVSTIKVTPAVPEVFGGYALVFDFGARGRKFGCTLVRTVAPNKGKAWRPAFSLDLGWPFEMNEKSFEFFKRVGIKGARTEGGYKAINPNVMNWAMQNDVTLMLTVGAASTPSSAMPLGRGRPYLRNGATIEGVKEDLSWLPSFDDEFQNWIRQTVREYGWPKGPVNALELWNEPWEGVSISGWGADSLRYREIFLKMAQAVDDVRKETGAKVLTGGACSSSNTRDKLFAAGKKDEDTFLKYLDFVSIHYQPLSADPALQPEWVNRTGGFGPVQVWDTESWMANSDDRVASTLASMRSIGQERTAGIYYGNVYHSFGDRHSLVEAWSPAASVAAADKFLGQRSFRELLFKNGLPWVYVFNGSPLADESSKIDADDGTVVVVGDLAASYDRNRTLFRSVKIAPDAKMELNDAGGKFHLLDFYGNQLPAKNGMIEVPLNGFGYYLRTDGSKGSFEQLLQTIRKAHMTGIEPVEILAHDMTAALGTQPLLRLTLTNVLNRPLTGALRVDMDHLAVSPAAQWVGLKPNETKQVWLKVVGEPNNINSYPLRATFDAMSDGKVTHGEIMRANVIAKRSIAMDGTLKDWKGVIPQTFGQANLVGMGFTVEAYLPFENWKMDATNGSGAGYLAYDDKGLYFSADVPSIRPMIRFATRDDDSYFYPKTVTSTKNQGKTLTWPDGVRQFSYAKNPDLPSGNGNYNVQIAFNCITPAQKHLLQYPKGTMPHYMVYEDTDYEFALNQCVDGGTEIFCLQRPGMWRKSFYPRQPKAVIDGGPVQGDAKLLINDGTMECFLPWSVIPEVKQRMLEGNTIKFSYRVNQGRSAYELSANRSVAKDNPMTFHNDWVTHWSNELEFGFEK